MSDVQPSHTIPSQQVLELVQEESGYFHQIMVEMGKAIIGNQQKLDFLVTAVLCNGHVLLEGVPGVAKTTMIKTLTATLGLDFRRIQFTPDLLPSDLIGTMVYNQKSQEFDTKKGPIFTNIVLADEINRAPAKVQSALLEAMQEGQVTIGNHTFILEAPFLVFATQNPIEQEGTYRLPEAQLDRFLMKILITYPTKHEEKQIIGASKSVSPIQQVVNHKKISAAQQIARSIYVDDRITDYIISIIFALRNPGAAKLAEIQEYIACGPSPRGTLALYHAAQAYAFLKRRHFVTPDDIKIVAPSVLRHRISVSYQADAEGITADHIISRVLATLSAP